MGKLYDGILGRVVGSTGNMTSYMLNGQNVTRVKARTITSFSDKQLSNQMCMLVLTKFLQACLPFLKVGFGAAALGTIKNYHNLATAYNRKYALKGVFPNIEIDYPQAMLSMGDLLPAINPAAERVNGGLKFSWDLPASGSPELANQVMLLAYGPKSGRVQRNIYGPLRSVGSAILLLDEDLQKEPLETYISFVSANRLSVANSTYIGRIEPS